MVFIQEEVMVEILMKLPIRALFKFKCVSKRYKLIISQACFAREYLQRAYSCRESWSRSGLLPGLLLPFTGFSSNDNSIKDLSNTDVDVDSINLYSVPLLNGLESHKILCSSNGLILSLLQPPSWAESFNLYVTNPLTKQCIQLPKPTTLNQNGSLEFALATRRDNDASAFLTYKVVIVEYIPSGLYINNSVVEIFSSDTGSWETRESSLVFAIYGGYPWRSGFSHKGILYWLNRYSGAVVTYNPFDSPDRCGHIQLPHGEQRRSHLIFSGDHEAVKYCMIEGTEDGKVDILTVWELAAPEGVWLQEHEFSTKHLHEYSDYYVMLGPNVWNRHLIYLPLIIRSSYKIIDSREGTMETVEVDLMRGQTRSVPTLYHPMVSVEICPWSSPSYHG